MTAEQAHKAHLGHGYWQMYVSINGYASIPREEGLDKLSKNLDLGKKHLRECIMLYLGV